MSRTALVFPVVPGKDAREIATELKSRPREYEQSRRRLGSPWKGRTCSTPPWGTSSPPTSKPEGDLLEKFAMLPSSDLDIDRYFVKASKEIHGRRPHPADAWSRARDGGRLDRPDGQGPGPGHGLLRPAHAGRDDRARAFVAETYHRDDFTASRRRLNVSEELITLHSTPQGDLVGIYIEGDDPTQGNAGFAASQDPSTCGFKEQLTKILSRGD